MVDGIYGFWQISVWEKSLKCQLSVICRPLLSWFAGAACVSQGAKSTSRMKTNGPHDIILWSGHDVSQKSNGSHFDEVRRHHWEKVRRELCG